MSNTVKFQSHGDNFRRSIKAYMDDFQETHDLLATDVIYLVVCACRDFADDELVQDSVEAAFENHEPEGLIIKAE